MERISIKGQIGNYTIGPKEWQLNNFREIKLKAGLAEAHNMGVI